VLVLYDWPYASLSSLQDAQSYLQSLTDVSTACSGHGCPYDFNRIEALGVDEPYWGSLPLQLQNFAPINDCSATSPDPRVPIIRRTREKLIYLAQALNAISPQTRFWINFSQPEMDWMRSGACNGANNLNSPAFDVVSLDIYGQHFSPNPGATIGPVKQYYDYLLGSGTSNAAPALFAHQQVALIPCTTDDTSCYDRSLLPAGTDPAGNAWTTDSYLGWSFQFDKTGYNSFIANQAQFMASVLTEFFAYAQQENQSCSLSLNPRLGVARDGRTGWADGCPVWMVAGWTSFTWSYYRTPIMSAIESAWHTEHTIGYAPTNTSPDPTRGFVESVQVANGNLTITGWALDNAALGTPVYIDVWDENFLGEVKTIPTRPDATACYQPGYAAPIHYPSQFSISIPLSTLGSRCITVYSVAPTVEPWNHVALPSVPGLSYLCQ
jgi:hypothetical protein